MKSLFLGQRLNRYRQKIEQGQFEFSRHALDQSIIRHINVQELREAIAAGDIIEDYPEYGPSCLIFGLTMTNRPVHIQYFSPDAVEQIQQTIWIEKKPHRVVETPVFEFAT